MTEFKPLRGGKYCPFALSFFHFDPGLTGFININNGFRVVCLLPRSEKDHHA